MIIDISWPVTVDITEYKDRSTVQLIPLKDFDRDGLRETMITLHNHTGTHIDAPSHFIKDGKYSDSISLEALNGVCRVLDMTHVIDSITAQDLEKHFLKKGDRVLLKTRNSSLGPNDPFNSKFVYVHKDAAALLAAIGIHCVGIDYLGIERNQPAHETHEALLSANIAIIEGLRLKDVKEGQYQLCCLPLKIDGIDGVPARAVLTL